MLASANARAPSLQSPSLPSDATPAALATAALEDVVGETVPSSKQLRYRNKATFFFAASEGGDGLVVGSKAAEDAGRVVPIGSEGCPLQAEEADRVLASLAAWATQTTLRAFDAGAGTGGPGAMWQAVLRTAPGAVHATDVHLDLVTAGAPSAGARATLAALAEELLARHPPLARVLHTEEPPPPPPDTGAARGRRRQRRGAAAGARATSSTATLAARGGGAGADLTAVVARPGGGAALRFAVAPRAFWQVNDGGTDDLVRLVAECAAQGLELSRGRGRGREPAEEEEARPARLLDLFCGAGLFGVSLATTGRFDSVLGLELGEDAVRSAGANARANGVGALCRFVATDLAFSGGTPPAVLTDALASSASDLVAVVDPPRAGLSGAMRRALRRSSARVLVYVSCDAQTLGRDLAELCGAPEGAGAAFRLARAMPVDLTPHAARIEAVCLLWRVPPP